MSKIRQLLSSKHQEISEKLSMMLCRNVKGQAQVRDTNVGGGEIVFEWYKERPAESYLLIFIFEILGTTPRLGGYREHHTPES